MKRVSGIYQITNLVNKKVYIGSSENIAKRWVHHKSNLRNNKHHSFHLQRSYNKHGEEIFSFSILATCPVEYLLKLEQWFLDNVKPEYNNSKKAGNCLGVKHTKESGEKKRVALEGRIFSEESKDKMRKHAKTKGITEDHKKVLANSRTSHLGPVNKQVLKICMTTQNVLQEYKSITEASKDNNTRHSNISNAVRGVTKSSGGFKWKYKK